MFYIHGKLNKYSTTLLQLLLKFREALRYFLLNPVLFGHTIINSTNSNVRNGHLHGTIPFNKL